MNEINIRRVQPEDIDDILAISILSFPTPWSRASFLNELESNRFARYVTAVSGETVVGYGGMWVIIDEAHITNIAVHPEFRSIGIGDKLLQSLIDICRKEGIPAMTLEVRRSNVVAQNLYKKFGFVENGVRKGYYEDNKEDAIIMWKRNI